MNASTEPHAQRATPGFLRRLRRAFLLLVATLSLVAADGFAQGSVVFEPARDLESFEAATLSPFSDLYSLEEYQDLKGKSLSKDELAAVRKRWKEERDKVEARITKIRSDPKEQSWHDQRRRIAKAEAFEGRRFVEARVGGKTMVLLEKPATEVTGWADRIAADIGPWFRKLEPLFLEEIANPLNLARHADAGGDVLCLLRDEDSYRAYLASSQVPSAEVAPALYDVRLRVTVGFSDAFTAELAPARARYPLLREYVRQLESAYCSGPGHRVQPLWIEEGLATYFAWHAEPTPDALDRRAIDPDMLAAVADASQDESLRPLLLLPLARLGELRDAQGVLAAVAKGAEARAVPVPDWKQVMRVYYAQAALWVHFLRDAERGLHREPFDKYLKAVFAGEGNAEKFAECFAGVDLAALDGEFLNYVYDKYEATDNGRKLDRGAIEELASERGPASAGSPKPKVAGASSDPLKMPVASPTFRPAEIAIGPEDVDARHALALGLARSGDLAAALVALEKLSAEPKAAPQKQRVDRDLGRVRQLVRLRQGFFEHLQKTKGTWLTQWKGRTMSTGIQKIDGDTLYFQNNKLGLAKVPLAQVSPYEVARQAGQPEQQGGAEPSTRAFAYLLNGDAKWDKLLKDDEGSKALRADAKSYTELLRGAAPAQKLDDLSKVELPKSAKEAKAICDDLRAFMTANADVPIVQSKLPALEQLAIHALSKTFVDQDPKSLAHGAWTSLSGGRVKLVYEFDKPEEAQDFVKEPGQLPQLRRKLKATALKEDASNWTVEGGALVGSGSTSYRLFIGFRAPLEVRWSVRVTPSEVEEPAPMTMRVSICDQGPEQSISCVNFGNLLVLDAPKQVHEDLRAEEEEEVQYDQPYELELRHDGTTASSWLAGAQKFEAPAGDLQGGWIRLWLHSDSRLAIEKLEIEGALDPASIDANKAARFRQALKELGFP